MRYRNTKEQQLLVKQILGENAEIYLLEGKETAEYFPELIDFEQYADTNYVIELQKRGVEVFIYSGIKTYRSERDKKFQHFRFTGNGIEINGLDMKGEYCFLSGRPFKKPVGDGWLKAKVKRRKIWVKSLIEETEDRNKFCRLIDLVEQEICYNQSCRYALYLLEGRMRIFFWEPDKYLFERQLKIYQKNIEALC